MLFVLLTILLFIVDWRIKNYADKTLVNGEKKKYIKDFFVFQKIYNNGAMLGFLRKQKWLLRIISIVLILIIAISFALSLRKENLKVLKMGLSLILAGATNNLMDRELHGHVTDYFTIKPLEKIIFNLSDLYIFIGIILLFIEEH